MPQSPNKITQFWQELKRRKVVRVITVYAAVTFVILQLVEILAPSLRLPEWTMNLILVLLIVGFIIAVILSWIYDVHPEGGIVKTAPAQKVMAEDVQQSSNSWKIASYISFVVIVRFFHLGLIMSNKGGFQPPCDCLFRLDGRRRAQTRREWLGFNLYPLEIGEIVQLKESNPHTLYAEYKSIVNSCCIPTIFDIFYIRYIPKHGGLISLL